MKRIFPLAMLLLGARGWGQIFHGISYVGDRVWVCRSDTTLQGESNLYYSPDNGLHWEARPVIHIGFYWRLWDVEFVTEDLGWAGGVISYIFRTDDAGLNWTSQEPGGGGYKWIGRVKFVDENIGWLACGDNGFAKTLDGGEHWAWDEAINVSPTTDFYGIAALDGMTAWMAAGLPADSPPGGQGYIAHTDNGGVPPWTIQDSSHVYDYLDIFFLDEQEGFAVGGMSDPPYSPVLLHTTDGGEHWQDITPEIGRTYRAIQFVTEDVGWICGRKGTILKTTDGGNTWVDQSYPTQATLFDLEFVDTLKGAICGDSGLVLFTFDGGETWELRSPMAVTEETGRFLSRRELLCPSLAKEQLCVRVTGEVPQMVQIFDASGRPVAHGQHGELRWTPSQSGVYIVKVSWRGEVRSQRVVIIK